MANTQAICSQFKVDVLNGVHAFSAAYRAVDTFKAALYTSTASIGPATTAYTATGEVSGTGYTAGGVAFSWIAPSLAGTVAHTTPSASIVFTNVTLSTTFDTVLLYNSSATGKNAISASTFTPQTITAGTLTLTMPVDDGTTGLIRFT